MDNYDAFHNVKQGPIPVKSALNHQSTQDNDPQQLNHTHSELQGDTVSPLPKQIIVNECGILRSVMRDGDADRCAELKRYTDEDSLQHPYTKVIFSALLGQYETPGAPLDFISISELLPPEIQQFLLHEVMVSPERDRGFSEYLSEVRKAKRAAKRRANAETRRKTKAEKDAQRLAELDARGLPRIETNDRQLIDKVRDATQALALYNQESPQIFHGPGGLATITRDKDGEPAISPLPREALQVHLSKAAVWTSTTDKEMRNVSPPRDLCDALLRSPDEWIGIPPIVSIVTSPFFDAQGRLCCDPGYHANAQAYLSLPAGFKLPDTTPTPANIAKSLHIIREQILGEVAFADEASRAHAIALMILPFVRRMMGLTPIHLWDASVQSSGKTYGAELCIKPFREAVATPEKKNDEENRKSIFAKLSTGASHVFTDNVRGNLSDPTLAAAVTSLRMEDRMIGTGQMVTVSTQVVWVATSNNAQLDRDAASRCVVIRLDTNEENPEGRIFRSNPRQYIEDHRAEVLGAILTLVRNWQRQGSPSKSGHTRSRFAEWERLMGGILEVNGIPGFLDNLDQYRDSLDPETEAWREFVQSWYHEHGNSYRTAKELLPTAMQCEDFASLVGDREGQAARFGKMLLAKRDRVFSGLKIMRASGRSNAGALWRVSRAPITTISPNSDDSDDSDDLSKPTRELQNYVPIKKEHVSLIAEGAVTTATTVTQQTKEAMSYGQN